MFGITDFFRKTFWAINISNMIISIILISVGTHCKNAAEFGSLPTIGGIIASGVLLFLISAFGCFAAYGKNQTYLFYFMISVGVLFVIQFSISIACVAGGNDKVDKVLRKHWEKYDTPKRNRNEKIRQAEKYFGCCGLDDSDKRCTADDTDDYSKAEIAFCQSEIPDCAIESNTTSTSTSPPTSASTEPTTTNATTVKPNPTTPIDPTSTSNEPTTAKHTTVNPDPTTAIETTTVATTAAPTTASTTSAKNTTEGPNPSTSPTNGMKFLLTSNNTCPRLGNCPRCHDQMSEKIHHAYNTCGGLGIFFSLLEPVTIFVTFMFRSEISKLGF